ncbi:glycosyl hydrolase, partial [mine drainage metagenome]
MLAVRVAPPPHPGIPYEKSIAAGPGNNGGALALDGPTFIATGGWDWMPVVPDRDIGIWQRVVIHASRRLLLRAPHVITRLPLPRRRPADVTIAVSVVNRNPGAVPATLVARFGGITVRKQLRVAPGTTRVRLTPAVFPALRVRHPHLWWPNGYGAPYLYKLSLAVYERPAAGVNRLSDRRTLHFGIREITYGLSLFDGKGRLRRVVVDPTAGTLAGTPDLINVSHRAIKRTPNGWAASLTAAGEHSAAVRPSPDTSLSPYLV